MKLVDLRVFGAYGENTVFVYMVLFKICKTRAYNCLTGAVVLSNYIKTLTIVWKYAKTLIV